MISDFDFDDGEKLCPQALAAAQNIRKLKSRAKTAGAPVIYVNDNYGRWNEDFREYAARMRAGSVRGRQITDLLAPEENDLYILKPQRSGFYETPLSVLLQSLKATNLIICGVATDICVLFTANDAYMRGFRVFVPADCSAAVEAEHHEQALKLLERVADANIAPSGDIDLSLLDRTDSEHDIASNIPDVEIESGTAKAG